MSTSGNSLTSLTIPSVAPVSLAISGGTSQEILAILQSALAIASVIPVSAPYAAAGALLMQIIGEAVNRIQSQTGKPIDLSTIPIEAPLP